MILTIDVGNTEVACGLFEGSDQTQGWRFATTGDRTADEFAFLLDGMLRLRGVAVEAVEGAAIGSVVPRLTGALRDACSALLDRDVLVVDHETPLPVRLDVDLPASVGPDRILNSLAVHERYGRDAVVVDLGTATTFDCVTAEGAFIGGVISPGVHTGADALLRRAARLARFEASPPERVIGRNTEDCLQSGIFWGAVDSIDGIVARILAEWGPDDVLVLATGGLAETFAPSCRTIEVVDPWLTLDGLRRAYGHAPSAGAPPH